MVTSYTTQLTDDASALCLLFCPEQRVTTEAFLRPALGLLRQVGGRCVFGFCTMVGRPKTALPRVRKACLGTLFPTFGTMRTTATQTGVIVEWCTGLWAHSS